MPLKIKNPTHLKQLSPEDQAVVKAAIAASQGLGGNYSADLTNVGDLQRLADNPEKFLSSIRAPRDLAKGVLDALSATPGVKPPPGIAAKMSAPPGGKDKFATSTEQDTQSPQLQTPQTQAPAGGQKFVKLPNGSMGVEIDGELFTMGGDLFQPQGQPQGATGGTINPKTGGATVGSARGDKDLSPSEIIREAKKKDPTILAPGEFPPDQPQPPVGKQPEVPAQPPPGTPPGAPPANAPGSREFIDSLALGFGRKGGVEEHNVSSNVTGQVWKFSSEREANQFIRHLRSGGNPDDFSFSSAPPTQPPAQPPGQPPGQPPPPPAQPPPGQPPPQPPPSQPPPDQPPPAEPPPSQPPPPEPEPPPAEQPGGSIIPNVPPPEGLPEGFFEDVRTDLLTSQDAGPSLGAGNQVANAFTGNVGTTTPGAQPFTQERRTGGLRGTVAQLADQFAQTSGNTQAREASIRGEAERQQETVARLTGLTGEGGSGRATRLLGTIGQEVVRQMAELERSVQQERLQGVQVLSQAQQSQAAEDIERFRTEMDQQQQAFGQRITEAEMTGIMRTFGAQDTHAFTQAFNSTQGDENYDQRYDFDGNGTIDQDDFETMQDIANEMAVPTLQGQLIQQELKDRQFANAITKSGVTGTFEGQQTVQEIQRRYQNRVTDAQIWVDTMPVAFAMSDFRDALNAKAGSNRYKTEFDFDENGVIDQFDLTAIAQSKNVEFVAPNGERATFDNPNLMVTFQKPGKISVISRQLQMDEDRLRESSRQFNTGIDLDRQKFLTDSTGFVYDPEGNPVNKETPISSFNRGEEITFEDGSSWIIDVSANTPAEAKINFATSLGVNAKIQLPDGRAGGVHKLIQEEVDRGFVQSKRDKFGREILGEPRDSPIPIIDKGGRSASQSLAVVAQDEQGNIVVELWNPTSFSFARQRGDDGVNTYRMVGAGEVSVRPLTTLERDQYNESAFQFDRQLSTNIEQFFQSLGFSREQMEAELKSERGNSWLNVLGSVVQAGGKILATKLGGG